MQEHWGLLLLSSPVVSGVSLPGEGRQGADALNLGVQIQVKDRNLLFQ